MRAAIAILLLVDRWGFDGMTLNVDDILGMERHVDETALESAVLALPSSDPLPSTPSCVRRRASS